MSVPLKVGRTAPMFVLSFFLHSIPLAGSALDSFQCLRSLLIVSFHVFFGLPRPRCPTTSSSVMLHIKLESINPSIFLCGKTVVECGINSICDLISHGKFATSTNQADLVDFIIHFGETGQSKKSRSVYCKAATNMQECGREHEILQTKADKTEKIVRIEISSNRDTHKSDM